MPVPTDTFWNISRLNKIFAISALLLLAVFGWSVLQDYDKQWRAPQRSGRTWEAAMVSDKLVDRKGISAQAKKLDEQMAALDANIKSKDPRFSQLTSQIATLSAEAANLDFRANTLKAVIGEQQKYLEEAKTAHDAARVNELNAKLAEPDKTYAQYVEQQAAYKAQMQEAKTALAQVTAEVDKLKKQRTKLTESREAMQKKLASLEPNSFLGNLSEKIRATPLMQFINPSEKVRQQVMPDVLVDLGGFKQVPQTDRCATCHVNIDNKDFTQEKVLGYLEEQMAVARGLKLAADDAPRKSGDPLATQLHPGPVAMAEFWLDWTAVLSPDLLKKPAIANRLKSISATVGKTVKVTIDGKPLTAFTFIPDAAKKADAESVALGEQGRRAVLSQVINAWLKFGGEADAVAAGSHVTASISRETPEKVALYPHKTAETVAEELHNLLLPALPPQKVHLILDRYRRAMVAEVNVARQSAHLNQLDPSPAMLAHPRLDLYVDVDSKHPMETVGCTSCHDGSGQETRFVLAAHTAQPIWVDQNSGAPVLSQQLQFAEPPKPEPFTLANMLRAVDHGDVVPSAVALLHIEVEKRATRSTDPVEIPDQAPAETSPVNYVDPVTGAKGKAISQLMYWQKTYETESGQSIEETVHDWDFPMRPPQYLQANCMRCHTQVDDIKDTAPVLYEGRHLFNTLGCANCHQMDSIPVDEQRKVGTDLRHVTAKLSPAMINTWIWAPKAFRPTTKMPHFFMLENNSSDEEIRRTRQEARSITEYLVQTADPLPIKHPLPAGLAGKAEDGHKIFETIGCLGCHQNLNDFDSAGPQRDGKPVTRGEQWIVQDLVLNGELAKKMTLDSGKPPSDDELKSQATKLYDGMTYNERQLYVLEHLDADSNKTGADTYDDAKHTVKPVFMRHGPELSGIGTKLLAARTPDQARAWLFDWLKEPRHYSAYTVMPQLRLTDQQAVDLSAYLLNQKRTNTNPDDPWKASLTETDTPKLIELTSLFLRSRYSPNTATEKADDIIELRALATDALTNDNVDRAAAASRVSVMEAAPDGKDELRMVFLGKKLIANYGCMQCHAINGLDNVASPCANLSDWGQKLVSKLDFAYVDPHHADYLPEQKIPMVNGLCAQAATLTAPMPAKGWEKPIAAPVAAAWPEVEHSRESWITHKLENSRVWDRGRVLLDPVRETDDHGKPVFDANGTPKIKDPGKPYDKLKMPTFYLSDEQITAITTFVISNRDRLISERLTAQVVNESAKRIAHGRFLTSERYNCTTCHQIEANKPQVQQYYDPTLLTVVAPPSLRGEGNKVQFDWLFNFFKNVQTLRPVLVNGIHMPSFPAADDEWTDILAYFSAASNKESADLKLRVDPILKYIAQAQISAATTVDDSELDPGDDWFTVATLKPSTAYLVQWGLTYKQITDTEIDSAKNSLADQAKGYKKLLYRARFTQELYAASYPFVDNPHPDVTKERFARGEAFFKEMQCLSCHYLGQAAPGAVPKAPNLNLAHVRLRREWAQHWVREPDVIQKGTSMPQFFSGQKIDDVHGQTWARASELPPARIAETEAAYGYTPQEQIDLLFDFIYAAGESGYTSTPLPSGAAPPSSVMAKNGEITVKPYVPPPPKPERKKPAPVAAPAPAVSAPVKPVAMGTVSGIVTLDGTPPQMDEIDMSSVNECNMQHPNGMTAETVVVSPKGQLKNVVVSVNNGSSIASNLKLPPAVIDQKGCQYVPHVVAMMTGQSLLIRNDDPFLHNVHSLSSENPPFNFGQPNKDPGKPVDPPKTPEIFRVKCDVHPSMGMQMLVFDHPFFAVTGDDGAFTLPPLPAGTYTLTFWQEKYGTQEKEITVQPDKKLDLKVSYKAK